MTDKIAGLPVPYSGGCPSKESAGESEVLEGEIVENGITVEAFITPFSNEKVIAIAPQGMSVLEIIEGLPEHKLEIWLNHEYLPRDSWTTVPEQGATVTIRPVPQRDFVRAALQIAVVVAAIYLAGPLGLEVGTALHAAFVAGVTLVGNLVINALIPPAVPKVPEPGDPPTRLASITGVRNQVARFVPIPRLFGRMRYYPPVPMTGTPYTELVGNTQYLRAIFILGYGPLDINGVTVDNTGVKTLADYPALADAIRIGDTPISNYEDVRLEVGDPAQFTLYSNSIDEQRVDLEMSSTLQAPRSTVTDNISNIRTTDVDTDEIAIDLEFPNGLFSLANNGEDRSAEVSFRVEYRRTGTSDPWQAVTFKREVYWYEPWTIDHATRIVLDHTVTDVWVLKGQTRHTLRRGLRWKVSPGQYDVRVTRYQTYNAGDHIGSTDCRWLTLKSIHKQRPFDVPNVVGLALRIKATDELSGALDNLSVEATSILPVWDGVSWTNKPTRTPAWAFVDALCGVGTRRPLNRDTEIDLDAMLAWAAATESNGFEFNYVCEGGTTLFELIRMITAAGRAAWAVRGNKLSVIREESEQVPRQLFSPRNATNFRLTKSFPRIPHALRVQFIDPTTWEDSEIIVYDDGYSAANATLYESLRLVGVTSHEQAWKLGRFHLAQARLRPETFTFDAHIDTIIAQRGDAIAINNDAFLNGLAAGRIKSTNSGNLLTNGDFEAGDKTGWVEHAQWVLYTDDPIEGKYSAIVYAGGEGLRSVPVAASPGQTVRLTAVVRRNEDSLPDAGIRLAPRWVSDPDGEPYFSGSVTADHTVSGKQFLVTYARVPEGKTGVRYTIRHSGGTTGSWIVDELYMELCGDGGTVTTFESDEELFMEDGQVYSVAVRYIDANGNPAIASSEITTVSPSTRTVTLATPLPNRVFAGDLFVFGTIPTIAAKIIKIEPDDDLHATITAVPLAPEILTADTGTIPDYEPLLNNPVDFNSLPPPVPEVLRVRSDELVLFRDADGSLKTQLVVDYKFPPGQPETRVRMRITETANEAAWRYYEGASDEGKISTLDVVDGTEYKIQLQAVNARGLVSRWSTPVIHTVVGKSSPPSDVTGFTATVEDFGILLEWDDIPDIDRDEYEIRIGSTWESATFLTRTAATSYRSNIRTAGSVTFLIKAYDTTGNESATAAQATISISGPSVSGLSHAFVGANILLTWTGTPASFQIREYEIRRGATWESGTSVATIRTTSYRQEADWIGPETWWVAAIDVAGNVGTPQSVVAVVDAPKIQSINPEVIDNNVLLRWEPIQGTLPIVRYEVRRGNTFEGAAVIGIADTTFSAISESRGGVFTYWVRAIDSAGNYGPAASVTAQVNEPPDFVLQSDFYSDGIGNNTNIVRISDDRRSVQFTEGEDSYVSLPYTILHGAQDFTIEFAVAFDRPPNPGENYLVLSTWDGVSGSDEANTFKIWFTSAGGIPRVRVRPYNGGLTAAAEWQITDDNIFDGRFRMYSIRRRQTANQITLFINGVSKGSRTDANMVTMSVADGYLLLGTNINGSTGSRGSPAPCRIDEVRFWSTSRSAAQIGDYWYRELDLNESGLRAYYRFNLAGNQITADDISPNDYNGTLFAHQNLPTPELLVPFPSAETVQDRELIHGFTTPQAQINAGYSYVCQPVPLTASIEEVYNTGVVLASSRIRVLPSLEAVVSGVTYSVTISTKRNIGDAWTSHGAGNADVYATNFQYVKVRVDFTAANARQFSKLTQLATKAQVKRKTDEGTVIVNANPTTVFFNVEFVDVESIVASVMGTTFALAIVDFEDVPNPTQFDIYTFDAAGNAITGRTVKWIARGV